MVERRPTSRARGWFWLTTWAAVGALSAAEDAPTVATPTIAEAAPTTGLATDRPMALGLGPLRISSQSPGQSLRLGLVPHTPADLATGEWKLYVGSSWVNVWADEEH